MTNNLPHNIWINDYDFEWFGEPDESNKHNFNNTVMTIKDIEG
jgi:hypothetical protein